MNPDHEAGEPANEHDYKKAGPIETGPGENHLPYFNRTSILLIEKRMAVLKLVRGLFGQRTIRRMPVILKAIALFREQMPTGEACKNRPRTTAQFKSKSSRKPKGSSSKYKALILNCEVIHEYEKL